jgi:hypothetical protein
MTGTRNFLGPRNFKCSMRTPFALCWSYLLPQRMTSSLPPTSQTIQVFHYFKSLVQPLKNVILSLSPNSKAPFLTGESNSSSISKPISLIWHIQQWCSLCYVQIHSLMQVLQSYTPHAGSTDDAIFSLPANSQHQQIPTSRIVCPSLRSFSQIFKTWFSRLRHLRPRSEPCWEKLVRWLQRNI